MRIFFKGFYNYFSKFLHVRNQEIKLSMSKNYGINIFDSDDPQSLTHTVELFMKSMAIYCEMKQLRGFKEINKNGSKF